jgi:hypothetical protein
MSILMSRRKCHLFSNVLLDIFGPNHDVTRMSRGCHVVFTWLSRGFHVYIT